MKQRSSQTSPTPRRLPAVCLCLLAALAGCRSDAPPANSNAANANAPRQQQPAAVQTNCGVPYYPVRAGLEKQYRVTYAGGGVPQSTYAESFADIRPDSFTLRTAHPQLTVNTGWNCTGEGMLALEHGNLNFANLRAGVKIETVSRSGVTVPAAGRWRVGESWESAYEIRVSLPASSAGPGGAGGGTIRATNKIAAEESVTVAAGTFRALRVESNLDMRMTVRVGQTSVPMNTNAKSTSWFAEGVGMVKSVNSGDFAGATTELIAVKE